MARVCELTGKGRLKANKVSHSNIKTRRFKFSNLMKKKWFVPELNRSMTVTLSAAAFKTISVRGGLVPAVLQEREGNLSERLFALKQQILKVRRSVSEKPKAMPEGVVANEAKN